MPVPTSIPGPSPTGGVADAARAVPTTRGRGEGDGLPMPRRAWAIVAVSFGTALVVLDGAIATVALPTIARDLHTDGQRRGPDRHRLPAGAGDEPAAAVRTRRPIGLRRLYQWGQLLFTVATACAFREEPAVSARRPRRPGLRRGGGAQRHLGDGPAHLSGRSSSAAASASTASWCRVGRARPGARRLRPGIAPWPWVFAAPCRSPCSASRSAGTCPRRRQSTRRTTSGAIMSAATFGLVIAGLESWVHGDSPVVSGAIVAAGVLIVGVVLRPPRARRGATDPAGRPARPPGAGAVDDGRAHRLPRLVGGDHRRCRSGWKGSTASRPQRSGR